MQFVLPVFFAIFLFSHFLAFLSFNRWTQLCEDLVWPWGCSAQFTVCCSESAAGKRPSGHKELHAKAACPSEQRMQRHAAMQQQPCWGTRSPGWLLDLKHAHWTKRKHSERSSSAWLHLCWCLRKHVCPVRFPRKEAEARAAQTQTGTCKTCIVTLFPSQISVFTPLKLFQLVVEVKHAKVHRAWIHLT